GDVLLSQNATLHGKVLRSDIATANGHAGTLVFVPVGPYQTSTGDDGTFQLNDLPEGTLSLAFFRPGYEPYGIDNVTLSGGQDLTLSTVKLTPSTTTSPPSLVKGRVRLTDGSGADG